jgi:hypothetical protein
MRLDCTYDMLVFLNCFYPTLKFGSRRSDAVCECKANEYVVNDRLAVLYFDLLDYSLLWCKDLVNLRGKREIFKRAALRICV